MFNYLSLEIQFRKGNIKGVNIFFKQRDMTYNNVGENLLKSFSTNNA